MTAIAPMAGSLILNRLAKLLQSRSAGRCAADVRLGLKYIGVQLDDDACGLAYRFSEHRCRDEPNSADDGQIAGRSAGDLLSLVVSENLLQRSIGLATANALIEAPDDELLPGDIRSVFKFEPGENVVMVGYFEPLVPSIRDQCSLKIYEIDTSLAPGLLESSAATEGLKNCGVALITSTSIINGTIDCLFEAAAGCHEVVILGPSTPLLPEAFAGTPVTLLSGIGVVNRSALLQVVSEGGGMKRFKPYVRKVNLKLKRNNQSLHG